MVHFTINEVAMFDTANSAISEASRIPWNKGKLTEAKPALHPKYVWSIRTKLQVDEVVWDRPFFEQDGNP